MSSNVQVTFVVPALNEEKGLPATVADILRLAQERSLSFEIVIFDDGSTDGTAAVADHLTLSHSAIRVVHNVKAMGVGFNYFRGVDSAQGDYVMLIPGDYEITADAIAPILDQIEKADMIIPYTTRREVRPLPRRIVSRAFVHALNLLFGLKLVYFNGPCLIRTRLVRQVRLRSNGFAYMAAILISLIKAGYRYQEVAIPLHERLEGRSKAVTWRSVSEVVRTLARLGGNAVLCRWP